MQLIEIGRRVAERRTTLQLTQAQLASLAGTLNDLGAVKLISLLHILGLSPGVHGACPRRGSLNSAVSANGSYQHEMTPERFAEVLSTGDLRGDLEAPVATLLDESPLPVVVQAMEEAATARNVPPKQMWKYLAL